MKSLSSNILERYPFRTEPARIGHYGEYPQGKGAFSKRVEETVEIQARDTFLPRLSFFTGIVNEKIDFMVDARNAGRGKLTGKLTGIKYHTDIEVNDLKDGRYACHYLVPQTGAYVLSLMWNGQHIPDSPYKVTIREAQVMKATSCVVEGEKYLKPRLL